MVAIGFYLRFLFFRILTFVVSSSSSPFRALSTFQVSFAIPRRLHALLDCVGYSDPVHCCESCFRTPMNGHEDERLIYDVEVVGIDTSPASEQSPTASKK
ncbi:hypothetical protein FA13DRAFT_1101640 [Coprinellus micaceus]|uniref:Secreted protein n=1 Tax=Coprinellus micaceus TaxID=71717 RepID=A0A4Y7SWK6_COPMI|nr:hypothetical protein FA13DRAFT_1101640 [Coprinellus micaceus]